MVGMRFPEELIEAVDRYAEENGLTRSEAIRRIVSEYLARRK